ncbi:MAG TPA: MraY family glycosyltransferase [Chitinophagales bacterium]|nr:MraY family glycosyltransferase [Chitinophagales bacterium]
MLEQAYLNIIFSAFSAFLLVYYSIPSLINIADIKKLFDTENERKSHEGRVPNLAGFAIFGAFVITFCIFGSFKESPIKYILSALSFVFMIGAKDDIVELTPYKKFLGQIIAAGIVVYLGDIRLTSFYGLFGVTTLPYIVSVLFSIVTVVFIINAFNLIDGINWLSSGVALVAMSAFGSWFYLHDYMDYAVMAACVIGTILAFMRYNYTPAKIFMGDSGSLSIGLLSAVLALLFIEESSNLAHSSTAVPFYVKSGPALAIAILIIPIFDTLRVFTKRIINGKSPFYPDKTHHHHKLLDLGLTHIQASFVLIIANILFIILAFKMQNLRNAVLIPFIFFIAFIASSILYMIKGTNQNTSNSRESISEKKVEVEKI